MWNEITRILKTVGKGVLVVENGKPTYLVIPYEERRRGASSSSRIDDATLIQRMIHFESDEERGNQEIQEMQETAKIRLEDLPF